MTLTHFPARVSAYATAAASGVIPLGNNPEHLTCIKNLLGLSQGTLRRAIGPGAPEKLQGSSGDVSIEMSFHETAEFPAKDMELLPQRNEARTKADMICRCSTVTADSDDLEINQRIDLHGIGGAISRVSASLHT